MKAVNFLKFIGILTVLSGLTISSPVSALTGNEFQRLGDTQIIYVTGAADQISMLNGLAGENADICFPEGNSYGQVLKIVTKFLSNHPERLHEPMPVLVYNALVLAFPCD